MADFSLDLNEDQLQIQKWVHDFAETTIRPAAHEWDEREETPWPIIEEAAKIGLYSWEFIANSFADPTGLQLALVSEELAWGDAGICLALLGTTLGVSGIVGSGTPEQIAEWVPQCFGTPDDIHVAAFAVSEPDAGSDVSSLRTRAVYDEKTDEWVLNGTKTWITNGGIDKVPNVHVVVASVEPELKARGHASFVVPPHTKGLSMGQKFQKMGIRASHTAEVVLDDVRIPGSCLLGGKEKLDSRLARAREGKSSRVQAAMSTFEASRPLVGAQALGIARAAYEYALDYAKERKAFGRAIIENQGIAFKLADMKMEIDAARLLVHRACWMGRNGKEFTAGEGSMSKLKAGEVAVWATEQAIQILGGYGYVREYPVERWHRDSKIYTIFEGTSEIQRLVIARAVSGVHIQQVDAIRLELDPIGSSLLIPTTARVIAVATIRERQPGVWEVRVFTGRDETGRPTQISRTVRGGKREAQRVAAVLESRPPSHAAGRTVTDVIAAWRDVNSGVWSEASRRDYESRAALIGKDPIAQVAVARLSVGDVERWHARMRRAGVGEFAIRSRHSVLRAALSQAVRWEWIGANVAARARLRQPRQVQRDSMSPDDVRAVIEAAGELDPAAALALRLAAVGGLRRAELAALQWTDFDFEAGQLTVDSSITVRRSGDAGAVLIDSVTKTADRRVLRLDVETTAQVVALCAQRDRVSPYLFSTTGGPPNPDRIGWWWKRAREASGIDLMWRLHDLRHWTATAAIGRGHDIRTVAGRLGHANPGMTLRVYAHALDAADVQLAESLGAVLDGTEK